MVTSTARVARVRDLARGTAGRGVAGWRRKGRSPGAGMRSLVP